MQEPEIFEQPVADKDPEALGVIDETGTYHTVLGSGSGVGQITVDDAHDDYHDFVYPEGSSSSYGPIGGKLGAPFLTGRYAHRQKTRDLVHCFLDHQPGRWGGNILNPVWDHLLNKQRWYDVALLGTGRLDDFLVSPPASSEEPRLTFEAGMALDRFPKPHVYADMESDCLSTWSMAPLCHVQGARRFM
jgi:hypothetical protein